MMPDLDLDPRRTALFLDFDGTLVDIAPHPDAIVVGEGLPDLLSALRDRLDGALAIVSGRALADIDRFVDPARLAASGLHGLEWRRSPLAPVERAGAPAAIGELRVALAALPWPEGVMIEDKGLTLAVHYRDAPAAEDLVRGRLAAMTAERADVAVLAGKMVVEVKPAGTSKATAVERFLAEPRFAGRVPVFVGDDVTDEDGMRVALARGGAGIKVGSDPTVAAHRLAGVTEVHRWLGHLAAQSSEHKEAHR